MTFKAKGAKPTLRSAARKLGVAESVLDSGFGVLPIDPARAVYTVRVVDAAAAPPAGTRRGVGGPFSNPRIAPFGRTKKG
ncbi:MAG TPA: hypothetical protein VJ890_20955 [Vineibacter sp.]|nr:hypothetical protein [Vineibacter sp.]